MLLIDLFEVINEVFAPCLVSLWQRSFPRLSVGFYFCFCLSVCVWQVFYFYFTLSVYVLSDEGDVAAFMSSWKEPEGSKAEAWRRGRSGD